MPTNRKKPERTKLSGEAGVSGIESWMLFGDQETENVCSVLIPQLVALRPEISASMTEHTLPPGRGKLRKMEKGEGEGGGAGRELGSEQAHPFGMPGTHAQFIARLWPLIASSWAANNTTKNCTENCNRNFCAASHRLAVGQVGSGWGEATHPGSPWKTLRPPGQEQECLKQHRRARTPTRPATCLATNLMQIKL